MIYMYIDSQRGLKSPWGPSMSSTEHDTLVRSRAVRPLCDSFNHLLLVAFSVECFLFSNSIAMVKTTGKLSIPIAL